MSTFLHKEIIVSEQERERRIFRYTARYGQHPETERLYGDAIKACGSIDYLYLTISEIARIYDVKPECLRNQLKRHYPEVLQQREDLRVKLGYVQPGGNRGLKEETIKTYARAVEMLRDTSLTVREAAERCGVSYQGLQQHLLFYHKNVADSRMLARTDALLKPLKKGATTGSGGVHEPLPSTRALYAPAVELYRTTRLSVPEIANQCGLAPHNLGSYLRKWHREEVKERRLQSEKDLIVRKKERQLQRKPTKSEIARRKYTPAIELLSQGYSLSDAAVKLGVNSANLSLWLKHNHPSVLETYRGGMMRLPSGKCVSRKKWEKYEPVATYLCSHPSKSSVYVAEKFAVPLSSMQKHISMYYPEIWERHCKAYAANAAKEREKLRKEKEAASAAAKGPSAIEMADAKYADAVELFATGEKSAAQVAEHFGFPVSAFSHYVRTHRPDLIEHRQVVYAKILEEKNRRRELAEEAEAAERELRKAQRRYDVIPKYEPAVSEYRKGEIGISLLAQKYGLCNVSLRNYIGTRYPELIEAREKVVREELDRKYAPAVQEIYTSKDSLDKIARRHGLSRNGFRNYIQRYCPHLMTIHKAVAG